MSPGEIRQVCYKFDLQEDVVDNTLRLCERDKGGRLNYINFTNALKRELLGGGGGGQGGGGGGQGGSVSSRSNQGGNNQASPTRRMQPINLNTSPVGYGSAAAAAAANNATMTTSPIREGGGEAASGAAGSPEIIQKINQKFQKLTKAFEFSEGGSGGGYLSEREIRRICEVYQLPTGMIERGLNAISGWRSDGFASWVEFVNNLKRMEYRVMMDGNGGV